jgi:hypothetical protein
VSASARTIIPRSVSRNEPCGGGAGSATALLIAGGNSAGVIAVPGARCAAESYLFEWVRDDVLKHDFNQLEHYFPPGKRHRLADKWKKIPKQLCKGGYLGRTPNLGGANWQDFKTLVCYRNGLVHARASRPETSKKNPKTKKKPTDGKNPVPTMTTLNSLSPGWAVRVIVALVRDLHNAVGTPTPAWLVEP